MTKTTKAVLSLSILGVGGYLLYKNFKKPTTASYTGTQAPTSVKGRQKFYTGTQAPTSVQGRQRFATGRNMVGYAGNEIQGVVGDRQRGITNPRQIQVHGTNWGNAEGRGFYDVQSSGWLRG